MVVVLVTATIVTVLNNSMITVVLAAVGRDLSATPSALGWTATRYLLPFAAGNALAGLLSDRVSLRRVFTLGLIVFAVGTVAAATAPSVNWLIIARGVQGAGGSVVPALSAVAIARVFEAGRRGPAFGLLAAGTGAAQAAGPVVGGVLGEVAGWRSLFWVSTVLVVPVLIGAARTLAAADHPAATPDAELTPPGAVRVASFAGACGVGMLALLTYLAVEILVPLQVAELNGTGVFATGLVLLPGALITMAISRAAGHWSDRRGDRRVAVVGGSHGGCCGWPVDRGRVGSSSGRSRHVDSGARFRARGGLCGERRGPRTAPSPDGGRPGHLPERLLRRGSTGGTVVHRVAHCSIRRYLIGVEPATSRSGLGLLRRPTLQRSGRGRRCRPLGRHVRRNGSTGATVVTVRRPPGSMGYPPA